MRFKSGAKPETAGKFTPKLRGPEPAIEHPMTTQEHPVSVQPVEPEDPRKTGSSEPMQREVLKRNVRKGHVQ